MTPTLDLLEEAGFSVDEMRGNEGKLVFEVGEGRLMIVARPTDIPTYVEYGIADVGIVGKDVLLEQRRDLYELLDLGYAHRGRAYTTQDKSGESGKVRARLVANRVSFKLKAEMIDKLVARIAEITGDRRK